MIHEPGSISHGDRRELGGGVGVIQKGRYLWEEGLAKGATSTRKERIILGPEALFFGILNPGFRWHELLG